MPYFCSTLYPSFSRCSYTQVICLDVGIFCCNHSWTQCPLLCLINEYTSAGSFHFYLCLLHGDLLVFFDLDEQLSLAGNEFPCSSSAAPYARGECFLVGDILSLTCNLALSLMCSKCQKVSGVLFYCFHSLVP